MRFEKQARVNSMNPTRAGVISSPDPRQQADIQRLPSPDISLRNQVPKRNVTGFDAKSMSSIDGASEDFVTEESERHNMVNDNDGVNIHRR